MTFACPVKVIPLQAEEPSYLMLVQKSTYFPSLNAIKAVQLTSTKFFGAFSVP